MATKEKSEATKKEEKKYCCICGRLIKGWGNNAWPVVDDGVCCDECNWNQVLPMRMAALYASEGKRGK